MKIDSKGIVGLVYKTQDGMEVWKLRSEEGDGQEGWEQINNKERRLVMRKRVAHNIFVWCLPTPEEECPPMSHRTDGALF